MKKFRQAGCVFFFFYNIKCQIWFMEKNIWIPIYMARANS